MIHLPCYYTSICIIYVIYECIIIVADQTLLWELSTLPQNCLQYKLFFWEINVSKPGIYVFWSAIFSTSFIFYHNTGSCSIWRLFNDVFMDWSVNSYCCCVHMESNICRFAKITTSFVFEFRVSHFIANRSRLHSWFYYQVRAIEVFIIKFTSILIV